MTVNEAKTIIGNRASWELRNMVKALKIHSWLNSDEDNARLEAAQIVLRERKRK